MNLRNIFIIILVLIFVYFTGKYFGGRMMNEDGREGSVLVTGKTKVWVEVADEREEILLGLSGRESIGENEGMLFIYSKPQKISMWMKEMRFPLDYVFINNGMVVEIAENVPAPIEGQDGREIVVSSKQMADSVLEVNSGWVEKNEVKVGDDVILTN